MKRSQFNKKSEGLGFAAFVLVFLFFTSRGGAYVIPLSTILDKISKKSGTGIYEIQQEITLQQDGVKPLSFIENWLVDPGQRIMRVWANVPLDTQTTISIEYFYENEKRVFQKEGKYFSQKKNDQFLYPLLFENKPEELFNLLKKMGVFSAGTKLSAKDYILGGRLTRNAGTPHVLYGDDVRVWVEQDANNLRKFSFSEKGTTAQLDEYSEFRRGLQYPRSILYKWPNGEAQVKVLKIANLNLAQAKKRLTLQALGVNQIERAFSEGETLHSEMKRFYDRCR